MSKQLSAHKQKVSKICVTRKATKTALLSVLKAWVSSKVHDDIFIAEEKKSKQAESPTCIRNRTHLLTSSQFQDLQLHNALSPS